MLCVAQDDLTLKRELSDIPRAAPPTPTKPKSDDLSLLASTTEPQDDERVSPSSKPIRGPAEYLTTLLNSGSTMNIKDVHNILIDGWEPSEKADDPLQKAIRAQMEPMIWDAFKEKLAAGDLTVVQKEMTGLVDRIMAIIPKGVPEAKRQHRQAELEANLNGEFLAQRVENAAFDGAQLYGMLRYVVEENILMMDAPVHDSETKAWLQGMEAKLMGSGVLNPVELLPEIFKWLIDKLDSIKAMMSNHEIAVLVPFILKEGAEYEARRFEDDCRERRAKGEQPLRAAGQWYKQARELTAKRHPGGQESDTSLVLRQGIVAMIGHPVAACRITTLEPPPLPKPGAQALDAPATTTEESSKEVIFPETLVWDWPRIESYQNEIQLYALVGSTLLMAKETLKAKGVVVTVTQEYELKTLMEKLLRLPRPTLDTITHGMIAKVAEMVWPETLQQQPQPVSPPKEGQASAAASPAIIEGQAQLADLDAKLRNIIKNTEQQPLFNLLKNRYLEVLARCLVGGEIPEEVLADAKYKMILPFAEDLEFMMGKAARVVAHHEKVYHHVYSEFSKRRAKGAALTD